MSLILPDGSTHQPARCNRCGAVADQPIDPPLEVYLDHDHPDVVTTITDHGPIVEGRCHICTLGATVPIDLRRDLTPHQQLALFVLAGAWLDGDPDADTDENVERAVIDSVGPDVAQRLARGVLALGINVGAQVHDQGCMVLDLGPGAPCTCRGGPLTLYDLAGVEVAMAAANALVDQVRLANELTANGSADA